MEEIAASLRTRLQHALSFKDTRWSTKPHAAGKDSVTINTQIIYFILMAVWSEFSTKLMLLEQVELDKGKMLQIGQALLIRDLQEIQLL